MGALSAHQLQSHVKTEIAPISLLKMLKDSSRRILVSLLQSELPLVLLKAYSSYLVLLLAEMTRILRRMFPRSSPALVICGLKSDVIEMLCHMHSVSLL